MRRCWLWRFWRTNATAARQVESFPRRAEAESTRRTTLVKRVLPGSTIGVLGSGQLGRMFAIAARRMGYRVHTFSPDRDSPTGQIADVEIDAATKISIGCARSRRPWMWLRLNSRMCQRLRRRRLRSARWCGRRERFCTSRSIVCARRRSCGRMGFRLRASRRFARRTIFAGWFLVSVRLFSRPPGSDMTARGNIG